MKTSVALGALAFVFMYAAVPSLASSGAPPKLVQLGDDGLFIVEQSRSVRIDTASGPMTFWDAHKQGGSTRTRISITCDEGFFYELVENPSGVRLVTYQINNWSGRASEMHCMDWLMYAGAFSNPGDRVPAPIRGVRVVQ